MKAADARAIRKSLGCIKRCGAAGRHTHHRDCPNVGKWIDDDAPVAATAKVLPFRARPRAILVPVHELEKLITKWNAESSTAAAITTGSHAGFGMEAGLRRCTDDVQTLIDSVTP